MNQLLNSERNVKRYIMFLNDRVHHRTVVSWNDFSDKISRLKTEWHGYLLPAIVNYPFIEGKNYYDDLLEIRLDFDL